MLHHGDIPQESREVLEGLIRDGDVRLVICTSTLAEGVNLPIRSLILYSVQRRGKTGQAESMLARDIKNLVGRAGRAGTNTKGLVICANPGQWELVQPVATLGAGEPVRGALRNLIERLSRVLAQRGIVLTNEILESNTIVHPMIDGVDSTLIDLIAEEVGVDVFVAHARQLADGTFAARQLPPEQADLLRSVFELRARRLIALRDTGELTWLRETGARVRLLKSVEENLLPARERWEDPIDALDDRLRMMILGWAWTHRELRNDLVQTFQPEGDDPELAKATFLEIVRRWMSGASFVETSPALHVDVNDLLAIHSRTIAFTLQTLVEQGLSLLARRLQAQGVEIAEGALRFSLREWQAGRWRSQE